MAKIGALSAILCVILPLLGQVIMRIIELGGSLSRPWLLYIPIFWIPPFTLAPYLLSEFGYVKSANTGKVYDNFILIPIIVKLLLSFVPLYSADLTGMYIIILLGSMLIANTIHILKSNACQQIGSNIFTVFSRALSDSFLQYSVGFILTFMLRTIAKLIPMLQPLILNIKSIDILYKLIIFLLWAMGFAGAYMILHMVDNNTETPETYCKKSPKFVKLLIGFILFFAVIFYEIRKSMNN